MVYRTICESDAEDFYNMLCQLDEETEYMMYEPSERRAQTGDHELLRANIRSACSGGDLLMGAFDNDGSIAGFIWAERGKQNRVRHSAYIVTGVLLKYQRQCIGNRLFELLDDWAIKSGVTRLELTVECNNTAAVELYKKHGFSVEGIRTGSMIVNGRQVDEYYMGKVTCGSAL